MPECCMQERVFEEGGATQAAAVATCAQVLMRVVGLAEWLCAVVMLVACIGVRVCLTVHMMRSVCG